MYLNDKNTKRVLCLIHLNIAGTNNSNMQSSCVFVRKWLERTKKCTEIVIIPKNMYQLDSLVSKKKKKYWSLKSKYFFTI